MDTKDSTRNTRPDSQYESSAAEIRRFSRRSVSICSWITLILLILGSGNLFPETVNVALSYLGLGILIGAGIPLLLLNRRSESQQLPTEGARQMLSLSESLSSSVPDVNNKHK
jgi:hypothetical protein